MKEEMRKLKRVKPLIGTITVPLGCTSGCPPMPNGLLLDVKSTRWVTGTGRDAWRCCNDSARWQEATGKALPTVGGGGETDVGGSAIEEAAHLEDGNEGRARG